jgi:predicted ArsR family transcriptional regulator
MNVEEVFCLKIRVKVLKLLFMYGQMNTSDLARKLRVNYKLTLEHLELLENEDIIQHRISGRTKFFRFANTLKAKVTLRLLEEWEKK